jgi:hypothetical protein
MKTQEIEINGEKYEIDLEKAESMGVIKKLRTPITEVKVGDLFYSVGADNIVIIQKHLRGDEFYLTGLDDALFNWNVPAMSRYEMVQWLNDGHRVWVGNINNQVKDLVEGYYPKK